MVEDQVSEPVALMARVEHLNSHQQGWATSFNNNDNAPAYWVDWDDDPIGSNWFSLDALRLLDQEKPQ
jgi:hypothetical protein